MKTNWPFEYLQYDPVSGDLFWKKKPARRILTGSKIRSQDAYGYLRVCFQGRSYKAHHVIWFLMTGNWPQNIDHADGTVSNNRWGNLRECSHLENMQNRKPEGDRKFKGVFSNHKRFMARIGTQDGPKYLGTFDTQEQAAAAYDAAAKQLFGAFARLNFSEEKLL